MPQAEIVQFQRKYESAFVCTACGADRDCDCNAPGMKRKRVEEYLTKNRNASNRQAAADLGVSEATARRARSGASCDAPATVTGRDGKQYPAARKSRWEGKNDDESAGALANFRAACNRWLPQLTKDDMKIAIDYFREKSGYF